MFTIEKQPTKKLLSLSDFHNIDSLRINRHIEEALKPSENHATSFGIRLPNYHSYSSMSDYLYPRASLERLITIKLFNNLLYYIDDSYDKDSPYMQAHSKAELKDVFVGCANILLSGEEPKTPHKLYAPCIEIRKRFSSEPNSFVTRLISSTFSHLETCTYDLNYSVNSSTYSLDNYIADRCVDGGMFPAIQMIEYANNTYLTDDVLDLGTVKEMIGLVAKIGTLANDLFSYEKEVIGENSKFNLLWVFMNKENLSFDEAVDASMRLINGYVDQFIDAEQRFVAPDNGLEADSQSFVLGLREQVIATWHWQMSTNRYRSESSPFQELRALHQFHNADFTRWKLQSALVT